MKIKISGDAATVNGKVWTSAPQLEEVCQAFGTHDVTEGNTVLFDGKPGKIFKYFDELGLGILELIPGARVESIFVFAEMPPIKTLRARTAGGLRRTEKAYGGTLELNQKELRFPLRFTRFPIRGELPFDHRIALGPRVSAHVSVSHLFVECVSFEFRLKNPAEGLVK